MGTQSGTQSKIKEKTKVRQTLDNRVYIPGLTSMFTPPIYYVVDSINVSKETGEITIKLRVININSEVNRHE